MRTIIDLHVHSKFSRACSQNLTPENIAVGAAKKGIDIVSTGDFTHGEWLKLLKNSLQEDKKGIFVLNDFALAKLSSSEQALAKKTRFIFATELSCIYKHKDKVRRVHHIILAPSISAVENFNKELRARGCNIDSDGRPIVGLHSKELLKILLQLDSGFELVPAHAWTPWFAVFGSKSGYDSLEECFEDLTPHVHAIETGLSSDPKMNWRIPNLDNILLVSNSDAHSIDKLGREANIFDLETGTYAEILEVLRARDIADKNKRAKVLKKFLCTLEFFPEEGKYHCDGHKDCGVVFYPAESKKNALLCPKCGRPLTLGVMYRVDELSKRKETDANIKERGAFGIPFKSIVPLREIIASACGVGPASKKVALTYDKAIKNIGNEFSIILDADIKIIGEAIGNDLAEGIERVRKGQINIEPGYDGVFGKVEVFKDSDRKKKNPQISLGIFRED